MVVVLAGLSAGLGLVSVGVAAAGAVSGAVEAEDSVLPEVVVDDVAPRLSFL